MSIYQELDGVDESHSLTAMLPMGSRIGPYEIKRHLAEGGMADVYRVWHTSLFRDEAMKVPFRRHREDPLFALRFFQEARLAAKLQHPNIVGIHAVCDTFGELGVSSPEEIRYFTMEFIDGEDLDQRMGKIGRLPIEESMYLLQEIASALDYAHLRGVIHRDMKPSNVLLSRDPDRPFGYRIKVSDFGIARAASPNADLGSIRLTRHGQILGTPAYLSPEQASGSSNAVPGSDQYSLAIIAYELLSGRIPFAANPNNPMETVVDHLRTDPPPIHGLGTRVVDRDVNMVLGRALAKDPAHRFHTCRAFIEALTNAIFPDRVLFSVGAVLPSVQFGRNRDNADAAPLRNPSMDSGADIVSLVQALLESSANSMYIKDTEGRFVIVNDGLCQLYKRSRAEIVGKTIESFFDAETAEILMQKDRDILSAGIPVQYEQSVDVDGTSRTFLVSKSPVFDASRTPIGMVGLSCDITDRKQREDELKAANVALEQRMWERLADLESTTLSLTKSEERFRATFDQAAVGIAHVAINGEWLRVNRRLCNILGRTREELVQQTLQEVTHLDDMGIDAEQMESLLAGKITSYPAEKRYLRPDGAVVWVRVTNSLVRNAHGEPDYVIKVIEDITDRKAAEQDRIEQQAFLRCVIDTDPNFIFAKDHDGRFMLANHAVAEAYGTTVEGLIGKTDADFNANPEEVAHFLADDRDTIDNGRTKVIQEEAVTTASGERRWLRTVKCPLHTRNGETYALGISTDITANKKLTEELLQAQKMEAVGRLAGGIAHDFNNMLAIMSGQAELLALTPAMSDPSVAQGVREIQNAVERAAALTRQLLAFSRKQVISPRRLDLNDLITKMHPLLRRLIREDIDLETVTGAESLVVMADRSQLEQAVMNLVINARDAMPRGGRLGIAANRVVLDTAYSQDHYDIPAGEYALLSVSDNGTGMDEETRLHVFEPFFTTKEAGLGTGLGLATVYSAIKQASGHIVVYSEPGEGSVFKVYLPLALDQEVRTRPASNNSLITGTGTILLVEDDDGVRSTTRQLLAACGYTVISAVDGEDAIGALHRHAAPVDLILTDLVMPRMSGRELVELVTGVHPSVKVLFMSGYTDDAIIHQGVRDHHLAFLQKPFTAAGLTRKIRDILTSVNLDD